MNTSTSTLNLGPRLALARRIGVAAGRHTLQYFQRDNYEVERKDDASPVTIADKEAEQLLRQEIAAAFPEDGILGEEFGEVAGSSGYRWILDPIDGTKSFISGVPLYGTMIGVEYAHRSVIGLVYIPGLDEGVYASQGAGCWHWRGEAPPAAARVSTRSTLGAGALVTSEVKTFAQRGAAQAYAELDQAAWITRTWGDCYGYLLVATGRAEVMIDPMMSVWDAAAIQPILEEAGGTFTNWSGEATIHSGEGLGTNGLVLEEVLAITRRFPPKPKP
jgi:histidinol phosphatase-like enzyme (inositol monophosphatase family)